MILIAGGGIGGLTLSIALRRRGIESHAFEKTPELKEVGAAIALWPNATRVFKKIGVLEALMERGAPITDCEIRTRKGSVIKRWKIPRLETPAVFVARSDLQSVLAAAVPQDALKLGRSCSGFEESEKDVAALFSSGEPARGDLLVGADGLHSSIRNALIGSRKPMYEGYTQWRTIVDRSHELLKPGLKIEWWGRGLRFGIAGNGRGRMNWYVSANRSEPEVAGNIKDRLLQWVGGWEKPVREIIEATPEEIILKTDIWSRPHSEVWGNGRVTLLGDAAHPTSPNLGQGAGMAIEDAECLAACLSEQGVSAENLRRYENLRKRRTAATTKRSALVGRMGQWSHPAMVAARTLFLKAYPLSLWERQLKSQYSYQVETT